MLQIAPSSLTGFAAAYDRIAARTIAPAWLARVLARLGGRILDRRLIAGADPADSPLLAARACWLTSVAHRRALAATITRVLASGDRSLSRLEVAANPAAVKSQARELTELAILLSGSAPLYARGIAMLGRLLSDGTGPVYTGPPYTGRTHLLGRRVAETRAALAG
jgi:hypothetical protein